LYCPFFFIKNKEQTMENTKNDDAVATLNPNWQEALDKVMHTSLMSRSGQSSAPPQGEEGADSDSTDLSDMDDMQGEDRVEGHDDADLDSSSDDDDSMVQDVPIPPRKSPVPVSRAARPAPQPNPPPAFPMVPPPVIHTPRDPRAEATRKRLEENMTLQREEKLELLGRLQYLTDEKGFKPFRVLGPDDALEDIRYEVFRANREMTKKRNVKMMQKALVTVGAGVEMMNSWYNPLKLRLDGFSKSLLLSIREYDEIFEELHWKYCDSVAMPPEMKLVMTLGSSLWFFHMSNHSTIPATPAATSNPAPPPPPPAAPANDAPQRRMNGPRMQSSAPDMGGPSPVGMDMTSLLSGLGMVQTLMSSGAKF
jgi:hypothetical protein